MYGTVFAVTQDKMKLKLYLNGELVGEKSNTYASGTQIFFEDR